MDHINMETATKTKKKSGITFFLPLTDWVKGEVQIGRYTGQETNSRLVLCADKYNWILTAESKESGFSPNDRKFEPGFRIVFSALKLHFNIDPVPLIPLIIAKLTELTKITPEIDLTEPIDLDKVGQKIDNAFSVNFCIHEKVYDRLFRNTASDSVGLEADDEGDEENE